MNPPKKVAAIITEYRKNSHADVIIGKILEGFDQMGGKGPDLQLASMYVDQFPKNDMSRALSKKYNVPIVDSIEKALTLGGKKLAVEGVFNIGEHGKYPFNDLGQHLYPRRRFFEGVVKTFAKCKQVVPVFNDKHLSAKWKDAKWMYDKAREMFIPMMAGSSLPVAERKPPLTLPLNCEIETAVAVGYGGTESYGFHMLETLQCMIERRKGGESGVKAVQYLTGEAMWQAMDQGRWSKPVLEAAFATVPSRIKGDYRKLCQRNKNAGVFLIEYRDGLKAAAAMMNGAVIEGKSGAFAFACQLKGRNKPLATHFALENQPPFSHFAELVKAIEKMIHTKHPTYPVERTLLTTGILDAIMISRHQKGKRLESPHLKVKYQVAKRGGG